MNKRPQGATPVASGHLRGDQLRTLVGFYPDTFETIRQMAIKDHCSFAEKVNELVEWALESIKEPV